VSPSTTTRGGAALRLGEEAPERHLGEARLGELLGGADDRQLLGPLAAVVHPLGGLRQAGAEQDVDGLIVGASFSIALASSTVRLGRRSRSENSAPPEMLTMLSLVTMIGARPERLDAVAQRLIEAADERGHADDRR
jgi:hypothetical protein